MFEVTLELCTFYKEKPWGLGFIKYSDPDNKKLSFRGIGIFNDGKLHNTPFTCINDDGYARFFTNMIEGRPADDSNYTYFNNTGFMQHVDKLETQSDVSGF